MHFRAQRGLTLLELVVASAILLLLATLALPMARTRLKRGQERELRWALRELRTAIDRYKDTCDLGLTPAQAGSECYPPDLETLVVGVSLAGALEPARPVPAAHSPRPHDRFDGLGLALGAG